MLAHLQGLNRPFRRSENRFSILHVLEDSGIRSSWYGAEILCDNPSVYLNQFASASTFRQGLLEGVFSPGEFLAEEGRFLVLEEFKRDPSTYFAILHAVAAGRTRPSEIATVAGAPYNSLGTYLASLLEMNLIENWWDSENELHRRTGKVMRALGGDF